MLWWNETLLVSARYRLPQNRIGSALNQIAKRLNQFVKFGVLSLILTSPSLAADLPSGFVRLADVVPTIQQDMLYAGSNNFLGRPAAGYLKPTCILTKKAADALTTVQTELAKENKALLVFDCYRPRRAVDDFVSWVKQGGAIDKKWSPKTARSDLIREGYIGSRSAHSRGSTVDLAIIDLGLKNGRPDPVCGYGTMPMIDFGGGFDCFDPVSRTTYTKLNPVAEANRRELIARMKRAGFKSYSGEWWHFTLRDEPYPARRFDFLVE